jgi:hypothetical protein
MLHKYATTVGLALALLGLASPVVFAQDSESPPSSSGVIATITAIDASTSVATLQTDAGEVFELPQRPQWHVGHKVLCDRMAAWRPRLQHCQPWEEAHSLAPRAGRFAGTELPRDATPKGLFSTTD